MSDGKVPDASSHSYGNDGMASGAGMHGMGPGMGVTNSPGGRTGEDANSNNGGGGGGGAGDEQAAGGGGSGGGGGASTGQHLNIKVTDNHNEVFFKIRRSTKLEKLMNAFCDRQGKQLSQVRFLFEGQRVHPNDTPDTLEMADGDTLEVHQEQVGGC